MPVTHNEANSKRFFFSKEPIPKVHVNAKIVQGQHVRYRAVLSSQLEEEM